MKWIGTLILLAGCFSYTHVDGVKVLSRQWDAAEREVLSLASTDLSCPSEAIHLSPVRTRADWVEEIQASGCGGQADYLAQRDGWTRR